MNYLDTFSGIGSASVAWAPLGWQALGYAENAAFPRAVLKHRFPGVRNFGDATKFKGWPDLGTVDLVCGGTPCQSFSIAGLRAGLADPRGQLTLTFLAIVDRYRPRWVVWENTTGVFSDDGGRSFAAILGALGVLGYGWAYRVLDSQYVRVDGFARAVPQRRRRVFVVGHSGDWRYPAAVFFEPESLQGDSPPRRQTRKGAAGDLASSAVGSGVSGTVSAKWHKGTGGPSGDEAYNLIAVPFDTTQITSPANISNPRPGDPCHPLAATAHPPAIAFQPRFARNDRGGPSEIAHALTAEPGSTGKGDSAQCVATIGHNSRWAVRRLMPIECERLMGLPDGWTDIPWRGKPGAPDGPRYRAIGNGWAVNSARWIGQRIDLVEAVARELAA